MRRFEDDDNGYLRWLAEHPDGFVINADRKPRPNYLPLHRANCRTINGSPARGARWTMTSIKLCGERLELESWARLEAGGEAQPCPTCM